MKVPPARRGIPVFITLFSSFVDRNITRITNNNINVSTVNASEDKADDAKKNARQIDNQQVIRQCRMKRQYTYPFPLPFTFRQLIPYPPKVSNVVFSPPNISAARANVVFSPPNISAATESRSDIFHNRYCFADPRYYSRDSHSNLQNGIRERAVHNQYPWMGHTVPIYYQVPPTPPATNITIHHHHYYNSTNEQGK